MAKTVWKDRKRTLFGLPWSFTRYYLTEDKLIIETGFLSRREEEIRLYRILDITLQRPFAQRLFGLGTVHLCTADHSTPEKSQGSSRRCFQIWWSMKGRKGA